MAQCAVQFAHESVTQDLCVGQLSAGTSSGACTGRSGASSQASATTGATTGGPSSISTRLEVVLGFHFDGERFKASEFHRERRELPVVHAIMTDIRSIPMEEPNCSVEEDVEEDGEEDAVGEMPCGDSDSDPDDDYNPLLDN